MDIIRKVTWILWGFLLLLFISPVAADYQTVPTLQPNINVPVFDPQTNPYMRFWWQGSSDDTAINPLGFVYSFAYVFIQFVGIWFYFIMYAIWLFTLWTRARGVEIVTVGMLATGAIWGALLPADVFAYLLFMLAMCITAIFFKLFYKR